MRWPRAAAAKFIRIEIQRLQDFQCGKGVVRGVAQLPRGELPCRPIAGGGGFRLGKIQVENGSHGRTHAHLMLAAFFPKNMVEIENGIRFDSQAAADLAVIVLQAEADFQHLGGFDEMGGHFLTFVVVQLEDEGFVCEGKLDDMGAAAFFSRLERRFGFGIKSGDSRRKNFPGRRLAILFRAGNMDVFRREAGKWWQERGLCFRGGDQAGPAGWFFRRILHRFSKPSGKGPGNPGQHGGTFGLVRTGWRNGAGHRFRTS